MTRRAYILGVGTAVPPHRVEQHNVRDLVQSLFHEQYRGLERLMPVFENTQIQTRYFSQPLAWFQEQRTFVESSAAYVETATTLIEQASRQVLSRLNIAPNDVGMVVVVSTTGIATPSLDAKLIQRLQLPHTTRRMPIWGLGCAGGVAGMARAAELVSTLPEGKCLLLAVVELCSLTFQRNDVSKSNIVASSLFGDGAAAVVLQAAPQNKRTEQSPQHAQILDSYSVLFSDTEDIMGWDVLESGLKVRFSRDIPTFIQAHLPAQLQQACASWGIEREQLRHFVVHAGGAKVLQAYREHLLVPETQLECAFSVLREFGNMSSASVLFALQRFLQQQPATNDYGVMMALGPGFSAEFVLFRW